jgi:hypothetical protein
MTTTVEADSDIWVHDYTTATGVQVAGHWRKRRAGTAAPDEDRSAPQPDAGPTEGSQDSASAVEASQRSPAPPPAAQSPLGPPTQPSAGTARLVAAETRYKTALVAAGVSTLKHRRGEDCDLQAAIKERSEAKAELEAARADLAQSHSGPPSPSRPAPPPRTRGVTEPTGAPAAGSSAPRATSAPPPPAYRPATTPASRVRTVSRPWSPTSSPR